MAKGPKGANKVRGGNKVRGKKTKATQKPVSRGKKSRKNTDGSDGEGDVKKRISTSIADELQQIEREQEEFLDEPMVADKADVEAAAAELALAADGDGDKEEAKPDPYLLADATYIQKDTRWRNKQRTLVFHSRGVTSRFRHLTEDIKKLLPHHKTEPKFDKNSSLNDINEVCELKNCNNVVYFESRKGKDLYMFVGRMPRGPTMKFQVLNIHTSSEPRLAGNCLLGSRPLLHFDKAFSEVSYLKLMKTMLTQAFGTPRNHPKSKPFHDHIMTFHWLDKKIWFRHYQISPETTLDENDPERQTLTEIGPRFCLSPIRILGGSFTGESLYASKDYMSPTAMRVHAKKMAANPYKNQLIAKAKRKERILANIQPEDPTDEAFV